MNSVFLDSGTLISVQVLSPSLAKYMNLKLSADGTLMNGSSENFGAAQEGLYISSHSSSSDGNSTNWSVGMARRRPTSTPMADSNSGNGSGTVGVAGEDQSLLSKRTRDETDSIDIYLKPPRRKSACERLIEYFFSY